MDYLIVNCFNKKAQMKVQQMAFVLVALIIFFALVLLFYVVLSSSSIENDAETIREKETIELVRAISGTPEFAWTATDCPSCIDIDKALMISENDEYATFWKRVNFLQIKRVYPTESGEECTRENYPDCNTITVVDTGENTVSHSAFVSLCRYDPVIEAPRCDIGKVIAGFETI